MKKILFKSISSILILAIIISTFSFFVYAENLTPTNESNSIQKNHQELRAENILSFSCLYNPQTQTVNIKGSMNHEAFALHGNSTLLIYLIPAGKTENDVINDKNSTPIAEASVSIAFAFSFKISSIEERYYRYAIFIRSAEGEYILTTEAQYAETNVTPNQSNNKDNFKGLAGNYSSNISSVNSQITIIPIYLDSIFADDSSGYIYQIDDHQISFDKGYMDDIDAQLRSLSLFNTTVYLQFLLRSGGTLSTYMNDGAEYALPNTFEEKTIIHLHAVTDFLVSRYSSKENGYISGIILGKAWDNAPKYNSFKDISFDKYVLMCGNYAAIVTNAAKDINSKINVMLSFDGNGFYVKQDENATTSNRLSSKKLLSSLMKYFDASSYSGLKCSILIEASETPLDITVNNIQGGIDINKKIDGEGFYIGQHQEVSSFLESLTLEYKSATKYYSILWTPKKDLYGNALCAAYTYAFYKLWADAHINSFIVEFSQRAENKENLQDLVFILKNINSHNSSEAAESTKNLLALFKQENWSEILGANEFKSTSLQKNYSADALSSLPKKLKGEFCYFDFSKEFLPNGWTNGVGSTDLRIDYLLTGEKALKATMLLGNDDFCDIIYNYEYAENISYTPYIKLNLEIIAEQLYPLFEIKFTFKGVNSTFESSSIVRGNTPTEVILDMTSAKDFSLLENVKISVRSLDDAADIAVLSIRDITGYSKKYSNVELSDLIKREREKQKYDATTTQYSFWYKFIVVTVIIAISVFLGFILIILIRKNSRSKKRE